MSVRWVNEYKKCASHLYFSDRGEAQGSVRLSGQGLVYFLRGQFILLFTLRKVKGKKAKLHIKVKTNLL